MRRRSIVYLLVLLVAAFSVLAWLGSAGSGIPVLTYHHIGSGNDWLYVSEADFEQQLVYLRERGYTTISVAELAEGLSGRTKLPDRPIVLTFDDGYDDNYQAACSSVVGLNRAGENLFMIRRMSVPRPKFGLWDFRLRLWWLNMLDRLEL